MKYGPGCPGLLGWERRRIAATRWRDTTNKYQGKFSIYTAFIVVHKSPISKNSNLLPCNSLKLSDDPLAKEESVQD